MNFGTAISRRKFRTIIWWKPTHMRWTRKNKLTWRIITRSRIIKYWRNSSSAWRRVKFESWAWEWGNCVRRRITRRRVIRGRINWSRRLIIRNLGGTSWRAWGRRRRYKSKNRRWRETYWNVWWESRPCRLREISKFL